MTKHRPRRHPRNNRKLAVLGACLGLGLSGAAPSTAQSSISGAGSISPPPSTAFPTDQNGLPTVGIVDPMAGLNTDPFVPPSDMPAGPAPIPPVPTNTPQSTVQPAAPTSTSTPGAVLAPPLDEDYSIVLENADGAEQVEEGRWILAGDVRIRYRKYVINADRADIDTEGETALFSGHVVMTAPTGEVVEGGKNGTVKIDLDANSYVVANSEAIVPESRFGIGLIEPLHVYDGVVRGQPNFIDARGCSFTTCDFVDPHYHFYATDMYIVPGKRLVAKHVSLYRRDHQLITWPYLIVPLDQRASTLNPEFGETPDEGYFAKFAIGYLLASNLPGILHVDLFQKKGVGLGFDQFYGNPNNIKDGNGEVSAYELPDRSLGRETISGSLTHRQEIGDVVANVNAQVEQDSYYISNENSQTISSQVSLARNVGNQSTSLTMNMSSSNYSGSVSQNLTSSLDETYSPTSKERLLTQFNLTNYLNSFDGTSTATSQLNSNVEYDEQDKHFDWKFLANKYSTLQSSGSAYSVASLGGLEKLPELDVSTDPLRASFLKSLLPKTGHLDFSYGAYNEPASDTRGNRVSFGVDAGTTTFKINSWQAVDLSGTFLQRFYSDNAAQYVLTDHDAYQFRIGARSTAAFRYDYLRPYGYTPFEFDFSGITNLLSANLAYQETSTFQTNLSTGYDINAARQDLFGPPQPWQNIALQSLYTPTKYFLWRMSSSYDLNHGQFLDFTNNWSVRGRYGQALDLGARYAPQQQRVSAITEQFDIPFVVDRREGAGWRLQTVAGYNGLSDRFDYQGVALTRSWHDWETTVIYQNNPIGFQTGSSVTFNIRLKAFPAYQPFGVGNFGQSLGTGLGTVY